MIVDVRRVQKELEHALIAATPGIDQAALALWNSGQPEKAREMLTSYSAVATDMVMKRWKELSHYLLVKYKDGNIMKEKDGKFVRTDTGLPPSPHFPGYSPQWYRNLVNQTGDHFRVIE
jgi:hypothetical protein